MEYNIERSSSVSMFKKQRKLNDGKVVWDSVVKLRKKNQGKCSKYPKNHLGIRNKWIKEFSNTLSDKASAYVLEAMCVERTSRQEEIAQTLLNRFNGFLEQEAKMHEPKTLTHKAMVIMADKLSLWLDKNVKVSENVGVRLRKIEEEEKNRLIKEIERLDQERKNREEEDKKQKMAEKEAEPKSAREVMRPPSKIDTENPEPEVNTSLGLTGMETGDDKLQEKDGLPGGEQQLDDGQQAQEDPSKSENELEGTHKVSENSQEGKVDETISKEGNADETVKLEGVDDAIKGYTDIADGVEEMLNNLDEPETEIKAHSEVQEEDNDELLTESDIVQPNFKEDVGKSESVESFEPDIPDDSPIRNVLGVGGTEDTSHPAPDVDEIPVDMLESNVTPSEVPESPQPDSTVPPSSNSEFSDRDETSHSTSEDTATLVELLGSGTEDKETDHFDNHELVDIQEDQGKSVDDKTNMVLHELAEIIAGTREEHSPLQEAIKDIMEKELEDRLGDKDAETINDVAGKVGTWMDKMVERAGEEYGERRSPSRVRSVPPRTVSLLKSNRESPLRPVVAVAPQATLTAAVEPQCPTPTAFPPEVLSESSLETFQTVRSPSHSPPVSQKPKGPIFNLRKVDPTNIFNVAGITNTKAKRKVRKVRGQSRHISQESLDLEEWAEWAGLVSDVGQNWAKWIEGVAQVADRSDRTIEQRFSYDVKEWKKINKELQREGDVWLQKVMKKQRKKKLDKRPMAVAA